MYCKLGFLSSFWIIIILFNESRQFDVPAKYYDISKHAGEVVELKCESDEDNHDFAWSKKKYPRGSTRIYMSYESGFHGDWADKFQLNGHNLIINNLTQDYAGSYVCVESSESSFATVSNVTLTVLEPCVKNLCPTVEEIPCTCPTMPIIPTFPTSEATTEKLLTTTQAPELTDQRSDPMTYDVECDQDCQDHDLLLCRRKNWNLKCESADHKCNFSLVQGQTETSTSSMGSQDWLRILHLSLHGFMVIVILILVVYIIRLRRFINCLTSLKDYEIPMLLKEEHKYDSNGGNTYDFIAEGVSKEDGYEKCIQSARDSELPAIPEYLEVIN